MPALIKEEIKDEEEVYSLAPMGCLKSALEDTSIADVDITLEDDRYQKFESAFIILERRMNDAGYITDNDGKIKANKDSEKPVDIFNRTIKGFYPDATEDQISAAWDLFVYQMERHGNMVSK